MLSSFRYMNVSGVRVCSRKFGWCAWIPRTDPHLPTPASRHRFEYLKGQLAREETLRLPEPEVRPERSEGGVRWAPGDSSEVYQSLLHKYCGGFSPLEFS